MKYAILDIDFVSAKCAINLMKTKRITVLAATLLAGCSFPDQDSCHEAGDIDLLHELSGYLEIDEENPDIQKAILELEIFDQTRGTARAITEDELAMVVVNSGVIRVKGLSGKEVEHQAGNSKYFTLSEFGAALEITEQKTRADTEWFGGPDLHHVYFEGAQCQDGVFVTVWGS